MRAGTEAAIAGAEATVRGRALTDQGADRDAGRLDGAGLRGPAFHMHHRLQAHRAGRRMDFAEAQPDVLAEALASLLTAPVDYRPVERDGAARAAAAIAGLV